MADIWDEVVEMATNTTLNRLSVVFVSVSVINSQGLVGNGPNACKWD